MAGEFITHLTRENIDAMIASSEPVLVDFWASWCGPCRMVAPIIDELAEEYAGKAHVCKVNVDDQRKLAERYRIMTIPTVAVFKNGELLEKSIGAKPKDTFVEMIEKYL